MKKFGFITNKYSVSALLLLCLLLTDVILHRGESRVMIPSSFSDKIKPVSLPVSNRPLIQKSKRWINPLRIPDPERKIPTNIAGISLTLHLSDSNNLFEVYQDSAQAAVTLDSLLALYYPAIPGISVWLELKNLNGQNLNVVMNEINRVKNKYDLQDKIIVESANTQFLKSFCDSGYFTSYSIPSFDPYNANEKALIRFADSVRNQLAKYPASSVSCFYFQYPVLKKFFPGYPILTRADNTSISIVSYFFKRQLENDDAIKAVLYPLED
jgi:hypothetical protein